MINLIPKFTRYTWNSIGYKPLNKLISSAFIVGSLGISSAYAEDYEYDVADLTNSYDFKTLGGVIGRLKPHGNSLMGDMVDTKTGSITLEHIDISIPGNSNLEVALRRKHNQGAKYHTPNQQAFGDWVLDLPVAYTAFGSGEHTVRPTFNDGCILEVNHLTGADINASGIWINAGIHTHGTTLNIPGEGLSGFKAKPRSSGLSLMDPKGDWVAGARDIDHEDRCAEVAVAPDGTKYKFGRHVFRKAKDISVPYPFLDFPNGNSPPYSTGFKWASTGTLYSVLLVTEVEDVHGNWVRYEYSSDDDAELKRIYSNDNRQIVLNYDTVAAGQNQNSRRVTHATAHGLQWDYKYRGEPQDTYRNLDKVILPNERFWDFGVDQLALTAMLYEPYVYWNCIPIERTFTIKHPDGALGTFTLKETRHVKSADALTGEGDFELTAQDVAEPTETDISLCNGGQRDVGQEPPDGLPFYRVMSLVSKQISGPNIPTANWEFDYRGYTGGSLDETWTQVTEPNNSKKLSTYHAVGDDHGLLKSIDVLDASNNYIESFNYEYDLTQDEHPDCNVAGEYGDESGACLLYVKRPQTDITHKRFYDIQPAECEDGSVDCDIFKIENEYDKLSSGEFIDFGRPNKVTSYSSLQAAKRVIDIEYKHFTAANIIGLTQKVTKNAVEFARYEYYETGDKHNVFRLGQLLLSYEYHSDGNVSKIEYNAPLRNNNGESTSKRYTEYSNYKRGIPQTTTYPKRTSYDESNKLNLNRTVNDHGWVTSITDLNGNTTGYGYDDIGRVTYIDSPNDTNEWLDTFYTWSGVDADGNFITPMTRVEKRCKLDSDKTDCDGVVSFSRTLTLDEMLRPTLVTETDNINTRYQVKEWDAYNQNTFTGYWLDISTKQGGTTKYYDALQRVTSVSQTGGGTIQYGYQAGNEIRVTDAENNPTTTAYLSYGQQSYKHAKKIESPEGVNTDINFDIYGFITSIIQSGKNKANESISHTEHRAYDSQKHLCKIVRGDVGTSVFTHNYLGELTLKAEGVAGGANNNCSYTSNVSQEISITHDNLGDVWKIDYPDFKSDGVTELSNPAPDITYTRDNNGRVKVLNAGSVVQNFNYNSLNLLEDESVNIAGKILALDYGYDILGTRNSLSYPDGYSVEYAPNGFGWPTKAQRKKTGETNYTYASAATYYSNGSINTFNYGNGYTHKTTLNSRKVPSNLSDKKDALKAVDYTYVYDNNLNVTSITDGINSNYSLTKLTYDGLDRLDTATGGSEIGSSDVDYDGLGNIVSYSSKGRNLGYNYNYTTNRLTSVTGFNGRYSSFSYDGRGNIYANGYKNFTYNRANQLVSSGTNSYLYDGNSKRVKQTDSQGTSFSLYGQDGKLYYRETDSGGINYVYLGNKLIAKDGFIAEEAGKQNYRPYGESIQGAIDDVGYTGHKFDKDLNLSYMQARYYDPVIGRFYSNDPVDALTFLKQENVHGFNRYAYANNNPYKYVDPDGMAGLPFNFGDLMGNNEGAQTATQKQNVVKKAAATNTKALLVNTGKTAETVMSLTPGGAKTKLATAVVSAGIKAAASDTPLETFGQEMAAEALGKGIGDKLGSVTKALPDIPGLDSAASDTIKEVAGNAATDAAKSAIKDEFVEEQ